MPDPTAPLAHTTSSTVFSLDPNHTGKRLVVIAMVVVGFAAGVIIIQLLGRQAGIAVGARVWLGIISGALTGAVLGTVVEAALRKRWPSGRKLVVDVDRIVQHSPDGAEVALSWRDVEVQSWAFVVTRHQAWVKKGWYCVALRLLADDEVIAPYTFLSPEDASALPGWDAFTVLIPRKKADDVLEEEFAAQKPLREAEKTRWYTGGELHPGDFGALVEIVARQVSTWPD